MFTLAKFRAIMAPITLTTATRDSHHCTCLGHLGQRNTDRNVSISCHTPQGDCCVSLLPTVLLTNVANVNDPLPQNTRLGQECKPVPTAKNLS